MLWRNEPPKLSTDPYPRRTGKESKETILAFIVNNSRLPFHRVSAVEELTHSDKSVRNGTGTVGNLLEYWEEVNVSIPKDMPTVLAEILRGLPNRAGLTSWG